MSLWRKLTAKGSKAAAHASTSGPPTSRPLRPLRLSSCGRVSVVGESHYQPALRRAAGGRVVPERSFEQAIPVQAVLVAEPKNRHDRNAVRVDVDGACVGYLPMGTCERYQPLLIHLTKQGAYAWCPGRIMGGGRGRSYGIHLWLAEPAYAIPANVCDGLELLLGDAYVKATKCDGAALEVWSNRGPRVPIYAGFSPFTIPRGKYAGEQAYSVTINGQRVGELTRLMSARYAALISAAVARSGAAGCEGYVTTSHKGTSVELLLPKVT